MQQIETALCSTFSYPLQVEIHLGPNNKPSELRDIMAWLNIRDMKFQRLNDTEWTAVIDLRHIYLHNFLLQWRNLSACIVETWRTSAAGIPDCLLLKKQTPIHSNKFLKGTIFLSLSIKTLATVKRVRKFNLSSHHLHRSRMFGWQNKRNQLLPVTPSITYLLLKQRGTKKKIMN